MVAGDGARSRDDQGRRDSLDAELLEQPGGILVFAGCRRQPGTMAWALLYLGLDRPRWRLVGADTDVLPAGSWTISRFAGEFFVKALCACTRRWRSTRRLVIQPFSLLGRTFQPGRRSRPVAAQPVAQRRVIQSPTSSFPSACSIARRAWQSPVPSDRTGSAAAALLPGLSRRVA